MTYPREIWNQIKDTKPIELIRKLKNDGWIKDDTQSAEQTYRHPDGRSVSIHYHTKSYGPKTLKRLLSAIDWSIDDMQRLKLIK